MTWIVGKKVLKGKFTNFINSLKIRVLEDHTRCTIAVKEEDLTHFRKLMNNHAQVMKNWRPVQDIGGRIVYSVDAQRHSAKKRKE